MSEILVKTYTRHRESTDKYYLKDWTAGDILQIEKDGYFSQNKHRGAKHMGVVLRVSGDIPKDFHLFQPTEYKEYPVLEYGRSKYIIDLESILTDSQLKDCFNHDLLVNPITINQSYLDLFISRDERTSLHAYDKSGSFDNETVDVGPNGHADANTFLEFESNVAISVGGVIGLADEDFDETSAITISGTGAASGKPVTFRTTGAGRHDGKEDATAARIKLTSDFGNVITVQDAYVDLDGLQIINDTLSNGGCLVLDHTGEANVSNCLIYAPASGARIGIDVDPPANAKTLIWNNIINHGYRGIYKSFGNSGHVLIIYNNTVVDASNVGIKITDSVGDASLYLKNNLVFNCGDDYNISSFTTQDYDYNMGEDAAFSGDSNYVQTSQAGTAIFTDYNNDDFHLAASGSDAENAGTDLRSDAQLNITDDIDGDSRSTSTPDIGADELVAGGNVNVSAATDALIITKYSPTINAEISLTATVDTLILTEYTVDVKLDVTVSAGVDALTLTEYSAVVNAEISILTTVDNLILTEYSAAVSIGDDVLVNAGVDNLLLIEHTANINAEINLTAGIDNLILTEHEVDVNLDVNILSTLDTLILTEHEVLINAEMMIAAGFDSLILLEHIANVNIGIGYVRRGQSNFGFSFRDSWR